MITLTAGQSTTLTSAMQGQIFYVTINGGSVANISGAITDTIGPLPNRKSYGPFPLGQSIVVACAVGEVRIENGDVNPLNDDGNATQADVANINVKKSNHFGMIEFGTASIGSITTKTYAHRRNVAAPFIGGVLIAYNAATTAPTANVTQYAVGVVGDTTSQASGFVPITFGGGKTSPGGAGLFAGGPGGGVLEMAISNPFTLNAIARSDGGPGYLVEVRTVANGSASYSLVPGAVNGTQIINVGGQVAMTLELSGDFVTTNQAGFGTPSPIAGGNLMFADLLLYSDTQAYTVGMGGDSISQGQYSSDGMSNEFRLACNQITAEGVAFVNFINRNGPATGSSTFGQNSIEFIKKIKPSLYIYTAGSPNDPSPSVAGTTEKQKNFLYALKRECDRSMTKLVICSQAVWQQYSSVSHDRIVALNSDLANFAKNSGLAYFDRYGLTGNGAYPPQLISGYGYPTGTTTEQAHLADPGYLALKPLAYKLLRSELRI